MIAIVSKINNVVYGILGKIGIRYPGGSSVVVDAPGNVKAFLLLIRRCEGTNGSDGYRMLFGGSLFTSFADHPRKVITKSGYSSSAAGAYQILRATWDSVSKQVGLSDFTPASQDKAAIQLIKNRGAYNDILVGNIQTAIIKCNKEWASLPSSPYGQPTRTMSQCLQWYKDYGGLTS